MPLLDNVESFSNLQFKIFVVNVDGVVVEEDSIEIAPPPLVAVFKLNKLFEILKTPF